MCTSKTGRQTIHRTQVGYKIAYIHQIKDNIQYKEPKQDTRQHTYVKKGHQTMPRTKTGHKIAYARLRQGEHFLFLFYFCFVYFSLTFTINPSPTISPNHLPAAATWSHSPGGVSAQAVYLQTHVAHVLLPVWQPQSLVTIIVGS